VSRGAALTGALLATLATPATWPMALATFLLRGGVVLVALPIVVLPSPVGLGNLLAPTLTAVVFRGVSLEVAMVIGLLLLAILAWVVVGGLIAATLEAAAARLVANEDGSWAAGESGHEPIHPRVASRILVARAVAHLPTGIVLIWGSVQLVSVAYRELTSPLDLSTPIALRVLLGAPEVIAVIVVAWMVGEIVGALAARRIALDGCGVARALREALVAAARHPPAVLLGFWVPTIGLVLVVTPSILAATAAWGGVGVAVRLAADPAEATLAVLVFVALWIVGLVLIAVTAAWRAAVWSVADREPRGRPADSAMGGAG
jgi:hypothetical protein